MRTRRLLLGKVTVDKFFAIAFLRYLYMFFMKTGKCGYDSVRPMPFPQVTAITSPHTGRQKHVPLVGVLF